MKHQNAAQQKQRAQTKRKYIASEAAPNASFQAKLEASGGIVPVSSLAKNKLDFSGRHPPPAAAANGAQHTRFDDDGNPVKVEAEAAPAGPAPGAASNKSAAQLLREKLKGGGSGGGGGGGGASSSQPAADAQQQQEQPPEAKSESQGQPQESTPVPEPSPKRVKLEGSQDADGDKTMSDAVSPSAVAAPDAANGSEAQQGVNDGDGTMEDVSALPDDEVCPLL